MHPNRTPAMISAPAVSAIAPAVTGAVMCSVSLLASAEPMQMKLPSLPNLPKVSLPKLPDLDLPNFGKKKAKPAAKAPVVPRSVPPGGTVRVRAAKGVVPSGSASAPTLAELTGKKDSATIATGDGYKRFPYRRMPGANMDNWKKIARDITPEP